MITKENLNKLFITFEGIDGSGKSTIIKLVEKTLKLKARLRVEITKEPGATELGNQIRKIILNNDMNWKTELMLFLADREDHLEKIVKPALKEGKIVLCDRYADSTLAYQSKDDKTFNYISNLIKSVTNFDPGLTFYLDIPVEESVKRINNRGNLNRLDEKSIKEKELIKNNYLKLAKMYPERIKVINANREIPYILTDILLELHKAIPSINLL